MVATWTHSVSIGSHQNLACIRTFLQLSKVSQRCGEVHYGFLNQSHVLGFLDNGFDRIFPIRLVLHFVESVFQLLLTVCHDFNLLKVFVWSILRMTQGTWHPLCHTFLRIPKTACWFRERFSIPKARNRYHQPHSTFVHG